MVRAYELMVIVDGDVDDEGVKAVVAMVNQGVTAGEGTVVRTDHWGKRRFAYQINHKWEGTYVVFEIATPASNLHELERALRIADAVVRHKLIRLPDREAARRGLLGEATPA